MCTRSEGFNGCNTSALVPDAPPPTQTAVIVPAPAVDSLVDEHRRHLEVAASWGVPAHVRILYPFVEPAQVYDDLIATLAAVLGLVSDFDCPFTRVPTSSSSKRNPLIDRDRSPIVLRTQRTRLR